MNSSLLAPIAVAVCLLHCRFNSAFVWETRIVTSVYCTGAPPDFEILTLNMLNIVQCLLSVKLSGCKVNNPCFQYRDLLSDLSFTND
jgi:hypothetical protein